MTHPSVFRAEKVFLLPLLFFALVTIATAQSTLRTQEEARQLAHAFLLKEQASPPSLATVTERNSLMLQKAGGLNIGKTETLKDDYGSAMAYVQQLQPQGFIIISADERITPVLAFSFNGELSIDNTINNPLLDLVVADIHARKRLSFAHEPLMQPAYLTQWGPFLQTTWTQGGPWSNQCPYAKQNTSGVRRPVGCVATAMAQIVNYWKYPPSVQVSDDEYIYISGTRTSVNDATGWGMPTIAQLRSSMSSLSYNVNPSEEGYLSFASGVKLHMDYGLSGSSANTYGVRDVLNTHLGFGSATAYSERSGVWSLHSSDVIEDIKNGWPVQIAIHKSGQPGGHSIVVDGYRDDGYFHLNYGWGANSPGSISTAWYNVPTNMPRYDVVHTVVYGIVKYPGWNQYGANERNTFGSVYAAPAKDSVIHKWRVSCEENYSYSNILIGNSGFVYAAVSPYGGTAHPFVHVGDQFGTTVRNIEIDQDGHIQSMCQGKDGDLFAAMESGYVYRIDPMQGSATLIFAEPNKNDIYALKIDDDGWLFAATSYRVYALARTGTVRWSSPWVVPSGTMMLQTSYIPAVDRGQQRLYVTYYNSSNKHAFLASINRLNGQTVETRDFGAIIANVLRTVTLGSDGTVYVAMPTTLYALKPNDLLGTPRWTRSFSVISTPPAVGRDGTLYFAYKEQSGSTWYVRLGAFDPVNGATRWSKLFQIDPEKDEIFQPYVSGNDVVIFTIEHVAGSLSTYTLHGYQDNGTSCEALWQYDAGVSGGDYAFGPGRTVYAWGKTGRANTIYALSDGDIGDPFGAGMDFENNRPPAPPSNPSPVDISKGLDTASVQLSWNSSDPDGHILKYSVFACALIDSQEAAFTPVATGITGITCKLTSLRAGTQYLWSVVATDGQAVAEGPVWSFTTIFLRPQAPTLATPTDTAKNIKLDTLLVWNQTLGATSYHLQLSADSSFSSYVVNDSTLTSTSRKVGPLSLDTKYYWRVRAKNDVGYSAFSSKRWFRTILTTGIELVTIEIPKDFALSQNYPNPFNMSTMVSYALPRTVLVSLRIFNVLGQEVTLLVNEIKEAGYYHIAWNANVPSGIYFYRLQAGEYVETKKMILIR